MNNYPVIYKFLVALGTISRIALGIDPCERVYATAILKGRIEKD